MRRENVLSHDQQRLLCEEITEKEIYQGLQAIGDDKAPGVDGYNAVFYKETWPVIQTEFIEAVQEFF